MSQKRFQNASTFFEQLKLVLELYDQAEMLGAYSPLAAPYFLGSLLATSDVTELHRGEILCEQIDLALESLWGGPVPDSSEEMLHSVEEEEDTAGRGGRYDCFILELNYFKRCYTPAPKSQSEIYNDILHISRPTHDRHLREAINNLGKVLLARLRPVIRAENPIPPHTLVGRDALLAACLEALENRKTVALSGAGGVGKSTLGAAIADNWSSPAVFWYTIRPTVNDGVDSFLFSLGYFLFQQGASTLWHQLVASGGRISDMHVAIGLAQSDLASLQNQPLLCIDEVDLLHVESGRLGGVDSDDPKHLQFIEFIQEIRSDIALLLMGQRHVIAAEVIQPVDEFTLADMATWLEQAQIDVTDAELTRLHAYTDGNPRLLELCIALYQSSTTDGRALSDALNQLPQSAAILPIWYRLRRHLSDEERLLLYALSVYRTTAPKELWLGQFEEDDAEEDVDNRESTLSTDIVIESLLERRLLFAGGGGDLILRHDLRDVIYENLTIETQEKYHFYAAVTRMQRGEHTAAAFHAFRSNQPDRAVEIWFDNREAELKRGQAGPALALLELISQQRLKPKNAKRLALMRSELYQWMGLPEKVIENLEEVEWERDEEISADANLLWSRAHQATGQIYDALEQSERSLDTLFRVQNKLSRVYWRRSELQVHQRAMQEAKREATLAQVRAFIAQGVVAEQIGELDEAVEHYNNALRQSKECDYQIGIADSYHFLGNVATRRKNLVDALENYERSIQYFNQLGNRYSAERVRSNVAAMYIQVGQFGDAVEPAKRAFSFFSNIQDSYWTALNASNLAEAHSELGDFEEAEFFAEQVFQQEEPHLHPYALFSMGRIRREQGQLDESELYYAQAREVAQLNQDTYLLSYVWQSLSRLYFVKGMSDKAREAADEAIILFQQLGIEQEVAATKHMIERLDA